MFNFLSGGRARTSNSTRRTRQPAKRQRQATLERLEERRLLSLGVTWGSPLNGILTIKQTTGDNANVILNIHETNAAPSPSVQVDTLTGSAETLHFISGTVPVKEIDVCLNNGNDTVYLNGTVSTTTVFGIVVPTNGVPTVKMQLGTTNQGGNDQVFVGTDPNGTADGIQANLLQINGTASSSQGGNHGYNSDCVNVDNSNINSLSISLGDANSDCVYVDDSLINTSLSVTEGSGKCDVIEAGYYSKDVLGGSVTFSQGSGNYDEASVEDSIAVGSISITQGDGKYDCVDVDGVCGLLITTGSPYYKPLLLQTASLTVVQGGGKGDCVYVTDSTLKSANISQGFGNLDQVHVCGVEFETISYNPETGKGTPSWGKLVITQGDGESDCVTVCEVSAKCIFISVGNGFDDQVDVSDSETAIGNLEIDLGTGGGDVVGVGDYSTDTIAGETIVNFVNGGSGNTVNLGGPSSYLLTNTLFVFVGGNSTANVQNVYVIAGGGQITGMGTNNQANVGFNLGLGFDASFDGNIFPI